MKKTNWMRVFLGGLLAGVVFNILLLAALAIYFRNLWDIALEALNPDFQDTIGFQAFWIVSHFILGILAVWFYSAIRPRYGAGPKTAVIAGFAVWILCPLSFDVMSAAFELLPTNLLIVDGLTGLVMCIIATLAGAWVHKEE